MLDLNLCIVHEENEIMMVHKYSEATGGEQIVESGTSNSPILNAGDEDLSSIQASGGDISPFNFDIVNVRRQFSNKNYLEDLCDDQAIRTEFVTQQLFPLSSGGRDTVMNQGQSNQSSAASASVLQTI